MQNLLENLAASAKKDKQKNKEFFSRLKKNPPKDLDEKVHYFHQKVFEKINCLDCGNCCKTLGPRITDKDILRISKHLKTRPSELTEKYFRIDEDHDYVFKTMPCPFIGNDNYCSIYESRPTACKNYPHTDRKKFVQLFDITQKNTAICPAVYEIVSQLRKTKIR